MSSETITICSAEHVFFWRLIRMQPGHSTYVISNGMQIEAIYGLFAKQIDYRVKLQTVIEFQHILIQLLLNCLQFQIL